MVPNQATTPSKPAVRARRRYRKPAETDHPQNVIEARILLDRAQDAERHPEQDRKAQCEPGKLGGDRNARQNFLDCRLFRDVRVARSPRARPPTHCTYCTAIGLSRPSSFSSFAFSATSIIPAALKTMSAMLPGTSRNIVKISTEIPNSVRSIKKKRLIR
jgi:hypothetical protein